MIIKNEIEKIPNKAIIIVRSPPGFGKTTFATKVRDELHVAVRYPVSHFEADQYFYRVDGVYDFNFKLLKNAHEYCFNSFKGCFLEDGEDEIAIVANTFTQLSEMQKYLDFARERGIFTCVYRMTSEYQNVHGVPQETISKMKERFEDFEGEILVGHYE